MALLILRDISGASSPGCPLEVEVEVFKTPDALAPPEWIDLFINGE